MQVHSEEGGSQGVRILYKVWFLCSGPLGDTFTADLGLNVCGKFAERCKFSGALPQKNFLKSTLSIKIETSHNLQANRLRCLWLTNERNEDTTKITQIVLTYLVLLSIAGIGRCYHHSNPLNCTRQGRGRTPMSYSMCPSWTTWLHKLLLQLKIEVGILIAMKMKVCWKLMSVYGVKLKRTYKLL